MRFLDGFFVLLLAGLLPDLPRAIETPAPKSYELHPGFEATESGNSPSVYIGAQIHRLPSRAPLGDSICDHRKGKDGFQMDPT